MLDCVRDLVVHSPVTSLSPAVSFSPSLLLARSRSACLSPSYFDVILPCYYLDHRSRLAVREVAEKRDRDEPRSRKEVPRAYNEANAVSPSISIVSPAGRLIILASVFFFTNMSFYSCKNRFIFILLNLKLKSHLNYTGELINSQMYIVSC